MDATTLLKATAALFVLGSAWSAHAGVTVTERLSRQAHTVFAGSGPVTDEYSMSVEETALAAPFTETQSYLAYVLNNHLAIPGEGRGQGTTSRDDRVIVERGSLVQLRSQGDLDGEAEHYWGGGIGQVSTSNTFSVRFTVTEPIDVVLEGEMNPTPDDYAEIRLQKVGSLFPRFQFWTLGGDSGPYLHTDTLEPGEYVIKAVMDLYILRTSQSTPPSLTEEANYTMTMTFGNGPRLIMPARKIVAIPADSSRACTRTSSSESSNRLVRSDVGQHSGLELPAHPLAAGRS